MRTDPAERLRREIQQNAILEAVIRAFADLPDDDPRAQLAKGLVPQIRDVLTTDWIEPGDPLDFAREDWTPAVYQSGPCKPVTSTNAVCDLESPTIPHGNLDAASDARTLPESAAREVILR